MEGITRSTNTVMGHLGRNFFRPRYEWLLETQKAYLDAMAEADSVLIKPDLSQKTCKLVLLLGLTREALLASGMGMRSTSQGMVIQS